MNGPKLTIPQIADEFKERTSESPNKVYFIDYDQLAELTGWTSVEMDEYRRGRRTFWDDVATAGEMIHVSIYFGWRRILSEAHEIDGG